MPIETANSPPATCIGCGGNSEPTGRPRGRRPPAPNLCKTCQATARRGLFAGLSSRLQLQVIDGIREAFCSFAEHKLSHGKFETEAEYAYAIHSMVGALLSETGLKLIPALDDGPSAENDEDDDASLPSEEEGKDTSSPSGKELLARIEAGFSVVGDHTKDSRVPWLVYEFTGPKFIRDRETDIYRRIAGRVKDSRKESNESAFPRGGQNRAEKPKFRPRYLHIARDGVSDADAFDQLDHITPATPAENLEQRDASQQALFVGEGLMILLSADYGQRDDLVVLLQLVSQKPDLKDEFGDRKGRGAKSKWPVGLIVEALSETSSDRPWDNKPWTEVRVDNARQKLDRWLARLMEKTNIVHGEDLQIFLAEVSAEAGSKRSTERNS